MKKSQLKKLKCLNATKQIMEMAKKEVPKRNEYDNQESFGWGLFMRCQVEKGILKVSLFLTRDLRIGSRKPVYQVFVDREARDFVTWDSVLEKWRGAKVDYLDWPHAFWGTERYMGPKDNKILQTYLGVSEGGYKGLLEYQRKIREEQLKKKHKKQTDPWDRYLEQVPELPKDWDHWVDKEGIGQNYMFYDYSRKKNQKGYCSWCEKEVSIEKPRHKKEGVCPVCSHKIQFKARGRAGSFWTDKRYVYLLQECRDGMVLREFRAWRCYKKGEYENPDYICQEERRVIYGDGMTARTFYYGVYKKRDFRWIETSNLSYDRPSVYWQYFKEKYEGQLYGISLPDPECRGLMRTGLAQFARQREQTDPEQYLYHLRKKPYLERLVKCGLFRLAEEVYNGKAEIKVKESSDFAKSIGIDRYRMKRLREHDGGSVYLKWLILEKHQGKEIPDLVIDYFSGYQMEPKDLDFISEQMSVVRIKNYLEKQHKLSGRLPKELLSTWADYLSMSFRLRRDITREIFFKPRNLLESHDEAVELCGNKEIAMRAVEVTKKYPDVDKICQSVKEKFEFADKKYRIVAPEKVEDIMYEGQALRHCADSSDIYYERIQNRESYIMFLRKAEEPDKPYYTLEVEPDGTIRQKRTVGDRQNKDLEDAVVFLRKWQEEIQKRLTLEDYRLAKESSRLRVEEFKKLREEKAKIWHGHLQGQLLADVLERDLMEAVRSAEMGDRNFDVLGDGLVSENLSGECEERIKQEEQETERKKEQELALPAVA